MRRYETISILNPSLTEEEIEAIGQRTANIVEEDGGTILKVDPWGLKKLAYPIQKQAQGYYVYTNYTATPEAVNETERQFKIDDRIMKFMTIKLADDFDPADAAIEEADEAPADDSEAVEE